MATLAQMRDVAQRQHLLETLYRMDPGRRMAAIASVLAQSVGRGRCREPEPLGCGLGQRAGKKRGAHTGPSPVDRAKNGCKRHIITDPHGVPLLVECTPANVRDDVPFLWMLDSTPSVKMRRSGPAPYKPAKIFGDAGYGFEHIIAQVVERNVLPMLAPRTKQGQTPVHGSGMGRVRYVVERTIAWLANFRRIDRCFERTGSAWQAFNELACCVICANKLNKINRAKMVA